MKIFKHMFARWKVTKKIILKGERYYSRTGITRVENAMLVIEERNDEKRAFIVARDGYREAIDYDIIMYEIGQNL